MAKKKIKLPKDTVLNKEIIYELDELFKFSSPQELREALTRYYFYTSTSLKDLPHDFQDLSSLIYDLIKFLEIADKQTRMKLRSHFKASFFFPVN